MNARKPGCQRENALVCALDLAKVGRAVFPCLPSKAPACPMGFKAATSDQTALAGLWHSHPGELVGIATGAASDLSVLDIDQIPAGRDWWAANRDRLPPTRAIRTRSGGLHLWFHNLPGLRCSAGIISPGIDVRADGGYVIAWHCAGLPVLRDPPDLAPWPVWLLPAKPQPHQRPPERPRVPDDVQTDALVRFVRAAPERQRNTCLYWAACRMAAMVASRLMSEAEAESLLIGAATHVGLPQIEAAKTIRSGLAAGARS